MKRIFTLALALLMAFGPLTYINASAEDATNVAAGKTSWSSGVVASYNMPSKNMFDGSHYTAGYLPGNDPDGAEVGPVNIDGINYNYAVVDLGRKYSIERLRIIDRGCRPPHEYGDNVGLVFDFSNTKDFSENVYTVKASEVADSTTNTIHHVNVEDSGRVQKYRYVRVRGAGGVYIIELEIYAKESTAVDIDNVAIGKPSFSSGVVASYNMPSKNMFDGSDGTAGYLPGNDPDGAEVGPVNIDGINYNYAVVDLGRKYSIERLRIIDRGCRPPHEYGDNANLKFDFSNTKDFSEGVYTVNASQVKDASNSTIYYVNVEVWGRINKYRYVRVRDTGGIYIVELEVYAKESTAVMNDSIKYYVAKDGNDNNEGSFEKPFATIQRAQQAVRELTSAGLNQDVEVFIREGVYEQPETLWFYTNDGGNSAYSVTYRGYNNEYPTISGGKKITGFKPQANGIWKTNVPQFETLREMTVNGKRVYRASIEQEISPLLFYDDPQTAYYVDGYYFDKNSLPAVENNGDVELRWGVSWRAHSQVMENIIEDPTDSNRTIAIGKQPWFMQNTHRGNSKEFYLCRPGEWCRVENALEFLDEPGEFYFNKETKDLYYMPKDGEDLNTAEIYGSVLEQVVRVDGKDKGLVKNLKFEGIKFAHSTFLSSEINGGYSNEQANQNQAGISKYNSYDPAMVEVDRADGIDFYNCVFYGTGATAIRFHDTVRNSNIEGNAIYDCGGSGIVIGCPEHSKNNVNTEPTKPERVDMWNHAKWEVSDGGIYGELPYYVNRNNQGVHPMNDITKGVKSWLKLSFDQAVTIDEIEIDFFGAEDSLMKHNIEIIASNSSDMNGAVLLYSNYNKANNSQKLTIYPEDSGMKYKYLMIRKTKVGEFGFMNCHIWTKDYNWLMDDIPRNINVKNNYLTRLGNYLYGAPGITAYYYNGLNIVNNEISYVPYSAISSGWGWNNAQGQPLKNLNISNNRISHYLMECNDGGGIYTLSRHDGATISGNYFSDEVGLFASIYNDEGSSGFTISNNVAEHSYNNLFFWASSIQNNIATKTYANHNKYRNLGTSCYVENINVYVAGNPTPEAHNIMQNSGLEPVYYEKFKSLVPDNKPYFGNTMKNATSYFFNRDTLTWGDGNNDALDSWASMAKNALSNTSAGTLPGQYGVKEYVDLKNAVIDYDKHDWATNSDALNAITAQKGLDLMRSIQKALYAYEKSLVRYSLSETINIAQNMYDNGPADNSWFNNTKTNLKNKIDAAKSAALDDYSALYNLESAILKYYPKYNEATMLGFGLGGYEYNCNIDKENKTVTVYVDENTDLSSVTALPVVTPGCNITPAFESLISLVNPATIKITKGTNQEVWTVKAELANKYDLSDTSLWLNRYGDSFEKSGNMLKIKKSDTPYMYTGSAVDQFTLDFSSHKIDDYMGTKIIFLSEKANIDTESQLNPVSYFELAFKTDKLVLTRVEGDTRKLVYIADVGKYKLMSSGKQTENIPFNNLKVASSVEGNSVRTIVKCNDNMLINALCEVNKPLAKGYFGIHNETTDLVLNVAQ